MAFMRHCSERIGARYFQTPRNTIKAFVQLMAILDQTQRRPGRNSSGASKSRRM